MLRYRWIVRLSGRTQLLSGSNPITMSQKHHCNNETIVNELRQRFWISRLRTEVYKVIHSCHLCPNNYDSSFKNRCFLSSIFLCRCWLLWPYAGIRTTKSENTVRGINHLPVNNSNTFRNSAQDVKRFMYIGSPKFYFTKSVPHRNMERQRH